MNDFHRRRAWWRRYRYDGSIRPPASDAIRLDFDAKPHSGWATGTVYQFAVGAWPGPIGDGVLISDVAFSFVEPELRRVYPDLHPMARYDTAILPNQVCTSLAAALRRDAVRFGRLRYSIPLQRSQGMQPSSRAKGMLAFPTSAMMYDDFEIAREFERNPLRYFELARLFELLADWFDWAAANSQVVSLLGI